MGSTETKTTTRDYQFTGICRWCKARAHGTATITSTPREGRRNLLTIEGGNVTRLHGEWVMGHECPVANSDDVAIWVKPIKGRKSDKPCNEACKTATGSSCTCSCRGENHGRDTAPITF